MSILDKLNKPKRRKAELVYNEKQNRFYITFDPDISKKEFMETWQRFEKVRTKHTGKAFYKKPKEPSDLDLILSVKILREFGIKFKDIHEAFRDNRIPYYSGTYRFLTEFDLQKYYNRNIKKI